jgi:hypothetical protein
MFFSKYTKKQQLREKVLKNVLFLQKKNFIKRQATLQFFEIRYVLNQWFRKEDTS